MINEVRIMYICLALILVVVFSACNKRIYIGMDDYGDVEHMSHEFKTGKKKDN